jgi:hypothetical protein
MNYQLKNRQNKGQLETPRIQESNDIQGYKKPNNIFYKENRKAKAVIS